MSANALFNHHQHCRPMHADDVEQVYAVEVQAYPFPWTRGNFLDSLSAGYSAWVLEEQGVLIGYALFMRVMDEAHLLNITITPTRQRRGLGRWLLDHCIEQARQYNAVRMLLEVRTSNPAAQRLYEQRGFSVIGRRRDYYPSYHHTREDAIVMLLEW